MLVASIEGDQATPELSPSRAARNRRRASYRCAAFPTLAKSHSENPSPSLFSVDPYVFWYPWVTTMLIVPSVLAVLFGSSETRSRPRRGRHCRRPGSCDYSAHNCDLLPVMLSVLVSLASRESKQYEEFLRLIIRLART